MDRISGSHIRDIVYAVDGKEDRVGCGGGNDTVYFDRGIDEVNPANCERRIGQ